MPAPRSNADFGGDARVIQADAGSFSFAAPADGTAPPPRRRLDEDGSVVRLTLNYATGDPVTTGAVLLPDWFDDFTETADRYYLLNGMDRAHAAGDGVYENVNNPGVFGVRFAADPTRVLTGVTVEKLSNSPSRPTFFVFFGASGEVFDSTPSLTADNPNVAVDEGQTAANTGTFGDPDLDAVTLSASVGTVVANADGTWGWSWATSDGPAQSQTVTVAASDGRGLFATATFQLAVRNVNPAATFTAPASVVEGQSADVAFSNPSDPSPDDGPLHYAWDFDNDGTFDLGDGTYDGSGEAASATVPASYFAQGPATRTVRGRVLDKDGGFTDYAADVAVLQRRPAVTADQASVAVDEGQTAANTGTWGDPGGDAVTLSASVGTVAENADGTWAWSFLTHDGPFESQTVVITATDAAGAVTTATFNLVVTNVAPDFEAGPDATLAPSDAGHFTRAVGFTDPGADLWTGWVDFGDGSGVQQLAIVDHTFTLDHVFPSATAATYTVAVEVSDGAATHADSFAVTVAVAGVENTPPAANPDAAGTDEDHAVTFGVLANDADAEGNIVPGLTVAVSQPAAGVLTNNGDGTFTFDPAGAFENLGVGQSATVTFTYRVTDALGASDVGTVTIVVTGVNDGPVAAADRFTVAEDGTLTVAAAGLLADDADPDAGDVLTVTAVNGAASAVGTAIPTAHGTVRVNADGSFAYAPDIACGSGSDSFTYTVSDGHGGTATAAVTVGVTRYTGVSVVGGVLRVGGGDGTDVVIVGYGHLWVNGTPYCLTGVTEVRVWGRGGTDLIDLTGLTVPAFVSGGSGSDLIVGGVGRRRAARRRRRRRGPRRPGRRRAARRGRQGPARRRVRRRRADRRGLLGADEPGGAPGAGRGVGRQPRFERVRLDRGRPRHGHGRRQAHRLVRGRLVHRQRRRRPHRPAQRRRPGHVPVLTARGRPGRGPSPGRPPGRRAIGRTARPARARTRTGTRPARPAGSSPAGRRPAPGSPTTRGRTRSRRNPPRAGSSRARGPSPPPPQAG